MGPQPYPVIHVVANPVRGLLDRTRSVRIEGKVRGKNTRIELYSSFSTDIRAYVSWYMKTEIQVRAGSRNQAF